MNRWFFNPERLGSWLVVWALALTVFLSYYGIANAEVEWEVGQNPTSGTARAECLLCAEFADLLDGALA